MNAAAIPGRIVLNGLADKFGPFNTILPVTLVCSVLLWALFGITDVGGTLTFAVLFGFFSGACESLGLSLSLSVSLAYSFTELTTHPP